MNYKDIDATMTLQEWLDQYYAENPTFAIWEDLLWQSWETVQAHDIIHVVFGLNSNSADELIVEMWTIFGCDIPMKKIIEVSTSGFFKELRKTFGPYRLVKRLILTLPRVVKVVFYALFRLKKKWNHFEYHQYLNTPLNQIRKEFWIKIM